MSTQNHDLTEDAIPATAPAAADAPANATPDAPEPLTDEQLDRVSGGYLSYQMENAIISGFKPRPIQDRD